MTAMTLTAAPSAAAGATLTITANRSAYSTVSLTRAATLDLDAARISGGGPFAGFVLQAANGGGESTAALLLRTSSWSPQATTGGQLAAGTYRLHVAATAPVRITIPVRGLPSASWRASTPLTLTELTPTWSMAAGPVITATARLVLTNRSVVFFVLGYRHSGQGSDATLCITTSDGLCGTGGELWLHEHDTTRLGVVVNQQEGFAVLADRPTARSGSYTARWQIVDRGLVTDPTAAGYVLG